MDTEAVRIHDLVIEAGALVDWLETGRGDIEIVGAALLYVRDQLDLLADHTADDDARDAACAMVASVDSMIAGSFTRVRDWAAA